MRAFLVIFSLFFTFLALQAEERPARAESFATFWTGFKTAVAKNDKEAVVAATDLPSIYPNNPRAKAEFLKSYPSIFTKKVQKTFVTAKPVHTPERDSYSVFCGDVYFHFEKVKGVYRFTDYGPND